MKDTQKRESWVCAPALTGQLFVSSSGTLCEVMRGIRSATDARAVCVWARARGGGPSRLYVLTMKPDKGAA